MNKKIVIFLTQILMVATFLFLWEFLSNKHIINSFIFSSPSKIYHLTISLFKNSHLLMHIGVTLRETFIAFFLSIGISFIIAIIFYEIPVLFKIFEPLLTVINSTPKVAIGPLIIILFGAGEKSIIIMALSITLIINILSIHNGFINVDKYLLKLLDTLHAKRIDKICRQFLPHTHSHRICNIIHVNHNN